MPDKSNGKFTKINRTMLLAAALVLAFLAPPTNKAYPIVSVAAAVEILVRAAAAAVAAAQHFTTRAPHPVTKKNQTSIIHARNVSSYSNGTTN